MHGVWPAQTKRIAILVIQGRNVNIFNKIIELWFLKVRWDHTGCVDNCKTDDDNALITNSASTKCI